MTEKSQAPVSRSRQGSTTSICNLCGGSLCPQHGTPNDAVPHGLVDASVEGGYDSEGLLDLVRYRFSLCERCLRELFTRCKVPPTVEHITWGRSWPSSDPVGEPWSFVEEQRVWEYQEFRRNGGHAATCKQGLCNAVKGCGKSAVWTICLSGEPTDDCACDAHKGTWENTINATFVSFAGPRKTAKQRVAESGAEKP